MPRAENKLKTSSKPSLGNLDTSISNGYKLYVDAQKIVTALIQAFNNYFLEAKTLF